MRTSKVTRVKKIASLGTAGFMVLAMSGVAVTAAQADTTAEPPAETAPEDSGEGGEDHEGGDEGHAGGGGGQGGDHQGGGGQGNGGGGGQGGGGGGGNHDGEEPPDDGDDGDDHGDDHGHDHGGGNGKGKGNPPAPEVDETVIEGTLDCDLGMPFQVETVTTVYEWVKGQWVLADESTTALSDVQYRPLTEAELAEFCVVEEQEPPADEGDDEVAGAEKTAKKPAAAPKAAPQAAAAVEVEVLGVEAEAPTPPPTAVSAGLGEAPAGSPLGSGMVAGGLGLLALAGIMAKRRPVLDESRR